MVKRPERLRWGAISFAASLALVSAICATPASATSITGNFNSDHCTGGCLTDQTSGGTVTVTDLGGGILSFAVSLANSNQFINGGFDASFGFNLDPSITSVTYSAIVPAANYTIPNSVGSTQTAGSLHMDGLGFFSFGLEGVGNGGSDPLGSSLTFDISATGLDLSDLVANTDGQFFGADIISGTTGNTGGIDVSTISNPPPVPEPATLALVGVGLLGVGLMMRRRRAA